VTLWKGQAGLEVEVEDLRRNLKVEVVAWKVEGWWFRRLRLEALSWPRFNLFMGSTQPTLLSGSLNTSGCTPYATRIHPTYCLSHSQFILGNVARLAAAMGVPQNQVVGVLSGMCSSLYFTFFPNSLFRASTALRATLGAPHPHTITLLLLMPSCMVTWIPEIYWCGRMIFQCTFQKSIFHCCAVGWWVERPFGLSMHGGCTWNQVPQVHSPLIGDGKDWLNHLGVDPS